eukprot:COSAG02_NODE_8829_length_2429_cov_2.248498_4_plen_105_part_00
MDVRLDLPTVQIVPILILWDDEEILRRAVCDMMFGCTPPKLHMEPCDGRICTHRSVRTIIGTSWAGGFLPERLLVHTCLTHASAIEMVPPTRIFGESVSFVGSP